MLFVLCTLHFVLCLLVCVVTFHPHVREATPISGLTPTSVILAYATWLLFTAVHPTSTSLLSTTLTFLSSTYAAYSLASSPSTSLLGTTSPSYLTEPIPGSYITSSEEQSNQHFNDDTNDDEDDNEGQSGIEGNAVQQSTTLSWFHGFLMLATMYVAMASSDWTELTPEGEFGPPWHGAMYVKLICGWMVLILYSWSLIAPVIFPDREWGTIHV